MSFGINYLEREGPLIFLETEGGMATSGAAFPHTRAPVEREETTNEMSLLYLLRRERRIVLTVYDRGGYRVPRARLAGASALHQSFVAQISGLFARW